MVRHRAGRVMREHSDSSCCEDDGLLRAMNFPNKFILVSCLVISPFYNLRNMHFTTFVLYTCNQLMSS
jgi:hypothetical protein